MKWFGAVEFTETDGVVRCTSRPLTTWFTDLAVEGSTDMLTAGYRFVERLPCVCAERWARWWLAPFLRAWNWAIKHVVFGWLPWWWRVRLRLWQQGIGCNIELMTPWETLTRWRHDREAEDDRRYWYGHRKGFEDGYARGAAATIDEMRKAFGVEEGEGR